MPFTSSTESTTEHLAGLEKERTERGSKPNYMPLIAVFALGDPALPLYLRTIAAAIDHSFACILARWQYILWACILWALVANLSLSGRIALLSAGVAVGFALGKQSQ